MLRVILLAAVASCGGSSEPAAAPSGSSASSEFTKKLATDIEDFVAILVIKATGLGCTVKSRATDQASLACAEGNIAIAKRELEVIVSCDNLARERCEALFKTIAEAK
jgi:hypothetical protein